MVAAARIIAETASVEVAVEVRDVAAGVIGEVVGQGISHVEVQVISRAVSQ